MRVSPATRYLANVLENFRILVSFETKALETSRPFKFRLDLFAFGGALP